jgi:hypothetical protein
VVLPKVVIHELRKHADRVAAAQNIWTSIAKLGGHTTGGGTCFASHSLRDGLVCVLKHLRPTALEEMNEGKHEKVKDLTRKVAE